MTMTKDAAMAFFDACETGKGWAGCKDYCTADATFAAQSGALEGIGTLEAYCDWMAGLLTMLPDGRYDLKGFALDEERHCALAFAVFHGTHTAEGGPVPPTGKAAASDYVYHIKFDGAGKVTHMDKVWNDGVALAQLGWA